MPETCWADSIRQSNKYYDWLLHLVGCFYLSDWRCTEPQTLNSKNSRTPFIRINWDGETSGYAENPDNNISLKIGYVSILKFGCNHLHYIPASKLFDHPWFEVLDCTVLDPITGNFKASLFCRILDTFTRRAKPIRITTVRISGSLLYLAHSL